MYNTAANKKKCDDMIALCKKNIKKIGKPTPDPVPLPNPIPGKYNFPQMEQEFIQQASEMGYQARVWWYSDNTSIVALMQMWNDYGTLYSATEFENAGQMDYMLTYRGQDNMRNYIF